MFEPGQRLLPPGSERLLARGLVDFVAALPWFALAMLPGGGETDLFGNGGTAVATFSLLAAAAAFALAISFGLRMASVALGRIPAWVPRVELWTWLALPVWFALALAVARS